MAEVGEGAAGEQGDPEEGDGAEQLCVPGEVRIQDRTGLDGSGSVCDIMT
ncbi:hypothetical protein [Streptomyces sp. NPDC012888]